MEISHIVNSTKHDLLYFASDHKSSIIRNLNDLLPNIITTKESYKSTRDALHITRYVTKCLHFACAEVIRRGCNKIGVAFQEIRRQKPLNGNPLVHHIQHIGRRPLATTRVFGYDATYGDSPKRVHIRDRCFEHLAPYVVKVYVDTIGKVPDIEQD